MLTLSRETAFAGLAEPGEHRLVAELVQNNTEPSDPPVRQAITLTAE